MAENGQLKEELRRLRGENETLTRQRDDLSMEIHNMKASDKAGPSDDDNDIALPPGVSSEAARKRLWRACKKAADG